MEDYQNCCMLRCVRLVNSDMYTSEQLLQLAVGLA